VDVALTLMGEAHAGQWRRKPKDGPQVPYATHPLLTCKLLMHVGINDPAMLMAALLHDALEPAAKHEPPSPYCANPDALRSDLESALCRRLGWTAEQAEALSKRVVGLVNVLTTRRPDGMDKREYLLSAVQTFPDEARLIKLADYAATFVCDLYIEPRDTPKARESLIRRNLSVAEMCRDVAYPEMNPGDEGVKVRHHAAKELFGLVITLGNDALRRISAAELMKQATANATVDLTADQKQKNPPPDHRRKVGGADEVLTDEIDQGRLNKLREILKELEGTLGLVPTNRLETGNHRTHQGSLPGTGHKQEL